LYKIHCLIGFRFPLPSKRNDALTSLQRNATMWLDNVWNILQSCKTKKQHALAWCIYWFTNLEKSYKYFFCFWRDSSPPHPNGPGPLLSQGFYITHNDASQSVGFLWTSDQLVTETSTCKHTTINDRHPWLRWVSNPQSQICSMSVDLICIPELLHCRQHRSENSELTSRSTPYRRTESFVLSFIWYVIEMYRGQSVTDKAAFIFKHTTPMFYILENLILLGCASFSPGKQISSSDFFSGRVVLRRWVSDTWRFGVAYQKTCTLKNNLVRISNAAEPEHRSKSP